MRRNPATDTDHQAPQGPRFRRQRVAIWFSFLIFLLVQLAGAFFLVKLAYAAVPLEQKVRWIYVWLLLAAVATNLVFWYVLRQNRLRRQTQEKLLLNSVRLEEAQRIGRMGNWEWNIGQGTIYWSDQVYRIFGRDPATFKPTYHAFLAAVHPDNRETVKQAVEMTLAGGTAPYATEHRIILPDGSVKTVREQGEVLYDEAGEPFRMAGTVQDISRQKVVEDELRHRMRLLTLNAEIGFALTRGDTLAKSLQACCEALTRHLEASLAQIWLTEPDGRTMALQASAGLHRELDGEFSRVAIDPLTKVGDIALHRQPKISNALLNDPQIKNQEWIVAHQLRGFAGHPLVMNGKVLGVMAFFTRYPLPESIIDSLAALADIIALGIEKKQTEQRVRFQARITEQVPDALITTDADGRITTWNQGAERLFGLYAAQAKGKELISLLPDEEHPFFRDQVLPAVAEHGRQQAEIQVRRHAGEIRRIDLSLSRFDTGHELASGLICYARDITERKKNEEQMRLSAKFLEETGEAVVITDADAKIVEINRAFERITGFSRQELLGKNPRILKSGRHDREFYQRMWHALLTTGHWEGEIWSRRRNSEVYPKWLSISAVSDEWGRTTHYVGISTDLTAIKQSQEKLENLTHYDQLTGLPNRLLLYDRLGQAIDRARQRQQQVALLLFDLDRFKEVNDTLGHSSGDAILAEVAKRLRSLAAETDTACRLGGDEFCLIMPEVSKIDEVGQRAQKILTAFIDSFTVDGHELYLTPSIGITLFPEDAATVETLLKNADTAMYHAKEGGGNSFQFYQEPMYQAVLDRMVLKNRLRQALEREEFQLYYQPKVTAGNHALCGAEALIRWLHPEDGLISPAAFIPMAEETGLIIPLGEWVIRQACRQSRLWRQAGLPPVRIAVNLSPKQFQLPDLAATIARIMEEEKMPADLLEIEITESILMDDVLAAIAILTRLKEMGIHLALDDFGTGYSSLNYLKRFPLDALKIDRSFVKDISTDQDDRAVIITIITLAHHLKMQVVAEGVETGEQAAFLRSKGCDIFQGYYFSKPLPARDFAKTYPQTEIPADNPDADF